LNFLAMNAREQLFTLYRRWRELSLAEGEAIAAGQWDRVDTCQLEKHALQTEILTTTHAARQEAGANPAISRALDADLRKVVAELIELEASNAQALTKSRADAERHRAELERSAESLRKLRKSYGTDADPNWESFS
jgi:hypothetical protein